MPDKDPDPPRLGAFALARRLVSGLISLAKLELQHGRQEIGAMVGQAIGSLVLFAIAIALVFAALMALTIALILGVAALLGWPGWIVALIVTLLLLGTAALLGWLGIRRLKIGPPEETIASVREEVAWAKRLIKRE